MGIAHTDITAVIPHILEWDLVLDMVLDMATATHLILISGQVMAVILIGDFIQLIAQGATRVHTVVQAPRAAPLPAVATVLALMA